MTTTRDADFRFETADYDLTVDSDGFRFGFTRRDDPDIAAHDDHGLALDGEPITETELRSDSDEENVRFSVTSAGGHTAIVTFVLNETTVQVTVTPEDPSPVELQLDGMTPSFGLGDEAHNTEDANMAGERLDITAEKDHPENWGSAGGVRFYSTFSVFPRHRFGGVIFWPYTTTVELTEDAYSLAPDEVADEVSTYFFLGSLQDVYWEYKQARIREGFPGVEPKPDLFDLGFETWDLLRWEADQKTTTKAIRNWRNHGYPFEWAVTGSGFWEKRGTSTSFGRFHQTDWPDPDGFREFLDDRDIDWMIGLRTSFVAEDTEEYDKGPYTDELLEKNYELETRDGTSFLSRKTWQPAGPNYLLDGEKEGAAKWYLDRYEGWDVDGIKEDTGHLHPKIDIYNRPMRMIAETGDLSMARCGAWSMPGTLHRANDILDVENMDRVARNFTAYGASAVPNNFTDTIGYNSMDDARGSLRHGWLQAVTAGIAVSDSPWRQEWDDASTAVLKKLIDFRLGLTPYIYDAAWRSHETGYPYTCTPLPVAYPDDEATYNLAGPRRTPEWLVGESLLAAPPMYPENIEEFDYLPADRHRVYLPEGEWMHAETGNRFEGGRELEGLPMPTSKAPVFVGESGVVVERSPDHDDRPIWGDGQRALVETFPAAPEPESPSKNETEAVVYPVATPGQSTTFHWPGSDDQTTIETAHSGWNTEALRVVDDDGAEVPTASDPLTMALRLPIEPGVTYRVEGGAGETDVPPARDDIGMTRYPLDEGSGTTVGAVGKDSLDGSIDGATWETVESGTDGDRDGACLEFDEGDCVETPATHLSGASRFSQVVAIRLEDDGRDQLIGSDDAGTHRLWYDDDTDALELRLRTEYDDTIDLSDSGFSPGSDSWIQIAWVFEKDAGVTLYRDGTPVATAEGTGASLAESTTRSIGAPSDRSGFVGMVRSIVEWNAVLARGTIETMAAE